MGVDPPPPVPHRDVVGAVAAWVFSLAGLGVSGLLTILKFRAANLCDESLLTTCGAADDACAGALTDAWSTVLGLPVTAFSAALYLVTACLAAVLLFGTPLARALARALLLPAAWLAAAASAALLLRTLLVLSLCPYCALLDVVALGLLAAAHLVNPHPRAALAVLRGRDAGFLALVVTSVGAAALLAQQAALQRAAEAVRSADLRPCVVRLRELADTPMVLYSSPAPRAVAAVFLDLTCHHCRDEFAFWRDYTGELAARGAAVDVRVYHYPRTGCSQGDLVRGGVDTSARRACDAARALTCLAPHDPSGLIDAATRLFDLQDRPEGFDNTTLAALAREFGWSADPSRPPADDPFFACMTAPATQALLRQHMRFAEEVAQLERPPGLLWIPLDRGAPTGNARQIQGRKDRAVYDRLIAEVTP